jgi:nicotinamidase-related amidase
MIEQNRKTLDTAFNKDPLKEVYHDSFVDNPAHYQHLISHDTALMCIDIQYLDAVEGYGVFSEPESSGVPTEGRDYYFNALKTKVLPNVRAIQDAFRRTGLEVIHTRIQSLTQDGRDRGAGHKRLGLLASPNSKEAEFVEAVAPQGDEIVINKTASGVITSTNFHYVLKNLGINALFITGVYTNECVETTARDLCDLGYFVTVIDDACTTVTPRLHEASLATLKDRYARVISTEKALEDIQRYAVQMQKK